MLDTWDAFCAAVGARLEDGATEYGDASFARPPDAVLGEIGEELLDQAAWSFVAMADGALWRDQLPAFLESVGEEARRPAPLPGQVGNASDELRAMAARAYWSWRRVQALRASSNAGVAS